MIHRDIKPNNTLVFELDDKGNRRTRTLKVCDFGFAREMADDVTN